MVVVVVVVVLCAGIHNDGLGAIVERVSMVFIAGAGGEFHLGQRDPISEIIDIIVIAVNFRKRCSGKEFPLVG